MNNDDAELLAIDKMIRENRVPPARMDVYGDKPGFVKNPHLNYTRDGLSSHPEYHKWEIGETAYGVPEIWSWNEGNRLIIGNFTSIASGVTIYMGGNHHTDWVTSYPLRNSGPEFRIPDDEVLRPGDVVIGNDVWIGGKVTIMSGVTIGHGAVIGACSVIAKDVPPYAKVVGNPAQVKGYRRSEAQIAALLDIAWWDWPIDEIEGNAAHFLTKDIDAFIKWARDRNEANERPLSAIVADLAGNSR